MLVDECVLKARGPDAKLDNKLSVVCILTLAVLQRLSPVDCQTSVPRLADVLNFLKRAQRLTSVSYPRDPAEGLRWAAVGLKCFLGSRRFFFDSRSFASGRGTPGIESDSFEVVMYDFASCIQGQRAAMQRR